MTCCCMCENRKEMVQSASDWMNATGTGERRSVRLYFEDGYVASGRFISLDTNFFTFSNELNAGSGAGNSSDTAWRREDFPYCEVKRIQRDFFREYGADSPYRE